MTDNELLQAIYNDTQELKQDVQELKQDMQELRQKTSNIENDVTKINLTLENEIRVNIQRVAEGHLDLSRNLHDAMKPSNEVEMLAIKVRMLETEVRDLKYKIS